MPDATPVSYGLNRLPKDLVLEVEFRLTQQFKLRYWLAKRLIRLAAWVLGCGIEVEDEERTPDDDCLDE